MKNTGLLLIIAGGLLVIAGLIIFFLPKIPFLGRLPGDITIQKKNFIFHFPVVTCILLSVIISFIFWLFSRK